MADKAHLVHRPRPRDGASEFAGKPVTVKIGTTPTFYYIHKNHLTRSSAFFKNAVKHWSGLECRPVELRQVTNATFNIYVNWLYKNELYLDVNPRESRKMNCKLEFIVEAYVLGQTLQDIDFKDAVCDAFIAYCNTFENGMRYIPNHDVRNKIYKDTPVGSKLRHALVHRMAERDTSKLVTRADDHDFLVDLAKKHAEGDKQSASDAARGCRYHEHERGSQNCFRVKYAK